MSGERRRRFLNYQTTTEKTHHSTKYRLFVCLQEFKYYYKPTLYVFIIICCYVRGFECVDTGALWQLQSAKKVKNSQPGSQSNAGSQSMSRINK